jgi:Ca2+-binding RTX toxin-like protein
VGQSKGAAIYGTAGNNDLSSTIGNDILTGAGGVDTFVFSKAPFGNDKITDFAPNGANHDVLQFDHATFATAANALAHATQVGKDVVIAFDAADTVTLVGVNLHNLTLNDFHIV